MKTIAFFNNKSGVGTTWLIYHLAWTWALRGERVLMVDFDPQCKLTELCVSEAHLAELWLSPDGQRRSIRGAVQPIIDRTGDVQVAHLETLSDHLALLPGDLRFAEFEQTLAEAWPRAGDGDPAAFRAVTSLFRILTEAAHRHEADLVLIDAGPNLGAITRSALLGAEYVITPLAADLFSIQGLFNLGPALTQWREQWQDRLSRNPVPELDYPPGQMLPAGYVVMQPSLYGGAVTRAYERCLQDLPRVYHSAVLGVPAVEPITVGKDPYALAMLRHYRTMMPLAQSARKPIFSLTAADGAVGAHATAAQEVGKGFRALAATIDARTAPADEENL